NCACACITAGPRRRPLGSLPSDGFAHCRDPLAEPQRYRKPKFCSLVRDFTHLPTGRRPDTPGVETRKSAKLGETSMDAVDIDREALPGAQAGQFLDLPVINPVTSVARTLQDCEDAGCALTDRRFITHLKFLTIMQRVIVGQKLKLHDEDKGQLYLGHLH